MNSKCIKYLGIGKTKFNSSVCVLSEDPEQMQILLTERLTRKKASGEWPSRALLQILPQLKTTELLIAENRDVALPHVFEDFYNDQFPFYEFLIKNNLEKFTTKYNPLIQTAEHHEAHAFAALAMSPFEKSIIVVMDGAGSPINAGNNLFEECSVYLQNSGKIELVFKRGVEISKPAFPNRIGLIYEEMSKYIFNGPTSSGKVMGLAPFGKAITISDRIEFQRALDWKNAFQGKDKVEWENSPHYNLYCSLAATVQNELEIDFDILLKELRRKYFDYKNLILTGGCALNCTNNAKIIDKKIFDKVYILPFPGDESIGFGLAHLLRLKNNTERWRINPIERQSAYLGPIASTAEDRIVEKILREKNVNFIHCEDVISNAVNELVEGKIIGWFQGRSESGPRALGNRSILARPDLKNLKNILNSKIKFREMFRPYGCSTLYELSDEYFQVDKGFENPFMSFAVKTKTAYVEMLKEVTHVDGTSRMQTVRKSQNNRFYELIKSFGEKTNIFCLLNTSLNVMGEPIVETIEDAIGLFEKTPIDSLYIGNFRLFRE